MGSTMNVFCFEDHVAFLLVLEDIEACLTNVKGNHRMIVLFQDYQNLALLQSMFPGLMRKLYKNTSVCYC
jgi:hypothetical protein